MADIGHNTGVEVSKLKNFFERIDRLQDEQKLLGQDIKEVKAEAKAAGFDMKAFNKAYALWKLENEQKAMLGVYVVALGVFDVLD